MPRLVASLLVCSACASVAGAQAEPTWIEQFGTPEWEGVDGVASDGAGGVFVAGTTLGDLGGPNAGGEDGFLARYDGLGDQLWVKLLGSAASDGHKAVCPDGAGGVFAGGFTRGDLDGPNAGSNDAFLARYDGSGALLWLEQFGTSDSDAVNALIPDGSGGVILAGMTQGSLGGLSAGMDDVFVAHYDAAGARSWITQFGSAREDGARALAEDGAGGVYITGSTFGDFGGPNAGSLDIFLSRLDASGVVLSIAQFGDSKMDAGLALAPDGNGGVFLGGTTQSDLGGTYHGHSDVILARFDVAGDQVWITQFGTEEQETIRGLIQDGEGGVFVTGWSGGNLGGGYPGVYLARHDGTSARRWVTQVDDLQGGFVASDQVGGVFVAGHRNNGGGEDDAVLARFPCPEGCYADANSDCALNLFDFLAFVNAFNADDPAADCTGDGSFNLFDFLCFVNAFNTGC